MSVSIDGRWDDRGGTPPGGDRNDLYGGGVRLVSVVAVFTGPTCDDRPGCPAAPVATCA